MSPPNLSPAARFGFWCLGVLLGLIALVTVVDVLRNTLPSALFFGVAFPAFGGLGTAVITTVLLAGKSDKDKDKH